MMVIWTLKNIMVGLSHAPIDEMLLIVLGLEGMAPSAMSLLTIAKDYNYGADDVASTIKLQYLGVVVTQTMWISVLTLILL